MDELAVVLLARSSVGSLASCQPLVFQKSGDLAHGSAQRMPARPRACAPCLAASSPSARRYSFGNTLTNLRAVLAPVVEDLAARARCRCSCAWLSIRRLQNRPRRDSPMCQSSRASFRLLLGLREHRLELDHRGVAALGELAVARRARRRCRPTCRRRNCGRSCPAPPPCRRSCIRSRGRPRPRPPPCAPELRTAKRSPATPRKYASPAIAP